MKPKVAIIGGGVSGVTLAILIQKDFDVTLFEREDKLLSKLLKTGNGRANIYNRGIQASHYNDEDFMGEHAPLMENVLDELFASLKILTMTDEAGRVYPYSQSAKALREELVKRLTCRVRLNTNIQDIKMVDGHYLVNGAAFDYLVLALGSSAGILKVPLDNNNNGLLKSLGLETSPLVPVIKTIKVKESLKVLTNQRVEARVSLFENGKLVLSEVGEVLFKEAGISGIVSFVVSSYFEWAAEKRPHSLYRLEIDLMPDYTAAEARAKLANFGYRGVFSPSVVTYLESKEKNQRAVITLTPIRGNRPENSQAIHGGIATSNVNPTFNLANSPTLFALGEVLNIDGICGGYNLAFAFYSAICASREFLNKLST